MGSSKGGSEGVVREGVESSKRGEWRLVRKGVLPLVSLM